MSGTKVVVTRELPEPAIDRLRGSGVDVWLSSAGRALMSEELRAAVSGADGVVTMLHDRVDEACLEAAGGQLQVVANVAVGYDNIDLAAARRRGARSLTHRVC